MARPLVILLISWAYVGCAARGVPVAEPPVTPGAELRIAVDRPALAAALEAGAVGEGLQPAPVTPVADGCSRFRFAVPARDPDGVAVLPQDVIVEWETRLRDPASHARWLLAPVEGAEAFASGLGREIGGLRAVGNEVEVCTALPAPDLSLRLAHPDLVFWRRDAAGLAFGPGPFVERAPGVYEPNPAHAGSRPAPARIVALADGDPVARFERGEADVVVTYGGDAGRLEMLPATSRSLSRAPAWDRRYALWMNPRTRWLNDPRFRRWVAARVDRPGLAELLFAGRAAPIAGLVETGGSPPPPEPVEARPVAGDSEPRFVLSYDATDADAARIAARLKALLRGERVEVTLDPADRERLREGLAAATVHAAVVSVEPFLADPLLALREWVARLGPPGAEAALVLDQAAPLAAPAARDAAVQAAEAVLVSGAVVVPLVRVEAWLVTRAGLAGVRAGPRRILDVARAGFVP